MVPRLSYLPLLYEKIKAHFLSSTSVRYDEIWLSMASTPLKWYLSVLFSLLSADCDCFFAFFFSRPLLRKRGDKEEEGKGGIVCVRVCVCVCSSMCIYKNTIIEIFAK